MKHLFFSDAVKRHLQTRRKGRSVYIGYYCTTINAYSTGKNCNSYLFDGKIDEKSTGFSISRGNQRPIRKPRILKADRGASASCQWNPPDLRGGM